MTAAMKSCPMCGNDAPSDAERCQCGYTFATQKGGGDPVEWEPETGGATSGPAERWEFAGRAFVGIGLLCLFLSLLMGTTVETGGPYGDGAIVNIGLQFYKGLAINGSLFAIGLGAFCLGVGAILDAIERKG